MSMEKIYTCELSTAYNLGRSNDRAQVEVKPLQDYPYFITIVVMTPNLNHKCAIMYDKKLYLRSLFSVYCSVLQFQVV